MTPLEVIALEQCLDRAHFYSLPAPNTPIPGIRYSWLLDCLVQVCAEQGWNKIVDCQVVPENWG